MKKLVLFLSCSLFIGFSFIKGLSPEIKELILTSDIKKLKQLLKEKPLSSEEIRECLKLAKKVAQSKKEDMKIDKANRDTVGRINTTLGNLAFNASAWGVFCLLVKYLLELTDYNKSNTFITNILPSFISKLFRPEEPSFNTKQAVLWSLIGVIGLALKAKNIQRGIHHYWYFSRPYEKSLRVRQLLRSTTEAY